MTDRSSGIDVAIARIETAILDIPMEGFDGADLADAFLALSLNVAEKLTDPRTIARVHLAMAERYFEKAEAEKPRGAASASTESHALLSATVQAMRQAGHDDYVIRHQMLGFAIAWIRQEEGAAGAEMIYRHADGLVARSPSTH